MDVVRLWVKKVLQAEGSFSTRVVTMVYVSASHAHTLTLEVTFGIRLPMQTAMYTF